MTDKSMGKYDDILYLARPASKRHPQMPLSDRAAQFAPFAALSGHQDAVTETARLTEPYIELDEEQKSQLDIRLGVLLASMKENPSLEPDICVTYFRPDDKKDGGAYVTVTGAVKKVDGDLRQILLTNGTTLPMDYIASIGGEVFALIDKL